MSDPRRRAISDESSPVRQTQKIRGGKGSTVSASTQEAYINSRFVAETYQIVDAETATEISQRAVTELNAFDREFYFDITITDITRPEDDKLLSAKEWLLRGHRYRVTCGLSRYGPGQATDFGSNAILAEQRKFECEFEARICYEVTWRSSQYSEIQLINGASETTHGKLVGDEWKEWSVGLELTIPSDAQSGTLTMNVEAREAGTNVGFRGATWLTVMIEQDERRGSNDILIPLTLLRNGVAVLLIQTNAKRNLVEFYAEMPGLPGRNQQIHPVTIPDISLSDCNTADEQVKKLRELVTNIWLNTPVVTELEQSGANPAVTLKDWFRGVVDYYGDECVIALIDLSEIPVPWELTMIEEAGREYRPVGATATMVRCEDDVQRYLGLGTHEYTGRAIGLLDDRTGANTRPLSGFLHKVVRDLGMFQYHLRDGQPIPFAAAYVAHPHILCHDKGILGPMIERIGLHAKHVETMRFDDVAGMLDARLVLFVNAPFSGLQCREGASASGLAHASLKQIADGYIGLLAEVDSDFADEIGEQFLREAHEPDGIVPARFLRHLRSDAFDQLKESKQTAEEQMRASARLHAAFMYVYYGNPFAHLVLCT